VATLLASCSGSDGGGGSDAEAAEETTTTTEPVVTTTAPAPLAEGAEEWAIAYLSTSTTETTVFLTNAKGEDQEVVAKLAGRAEALRWSPDGTRLLLDGDATGDFEVSVIDAATGGATAIAPSATSNEGGAVWSPDGTQIAFFSDREGGAFAGYVVPAAGGEVRRITPPEVPGVADLTWSPDGTTIAFSSTEGLDSSVWTVGADGTGARKVSPDAGSAQPAWSPDGDLLAITAQPLGEDSAGIYLLDPATGEAEVLADTDFRDAFPVWAPDGEGVYFTSEVPNDDADGGAADDLYLVPLEGGEPEAVIADPISVESELTPTPDGLLIAFSVQRLGDKEIFVANADGSGAIPISRSERLDAWAAWRPGTGPTAEG
jgi:Tol biopolymer transport system component